MPQAVELVLVQGHMAELCSRVIEQGRQPSVRPSTSHRQCFSGLLEVDAQRLHPATRLPLEAHSEVRPVLHPLSKLPPRLRRLWDMRRLMNILEASPRAVQQQSNLPG